MYRWSGSQVYKFDICNSMYIIMQEPSTSATLWLCCSKNVLTRFLCDLVADNNVGEGRLGYPQINYWCRKPRYVINCWWLSPHYQRGTKLSRNRSWHVLSSLENFSAIDRGTKSGSWSVWGYLHTFQMRPACVLDASRIWQKGVWHSCTSCCSFIPRFCACTDISRTCPRHVLHVFQMRANVTLELNCTVVSNLTIGFYQI